MERLQTICNAEGLEVEGLALERLISLTCGDLRRAVNLLQVCCAIIRGELGTALACAAIARLVGAHLGFDYRSETLGISAVSEPFQI